jgi:23S rRNA (cytosine1962-C5)-methyltransferase
MSNSVNLLTPEHWQNYALLDVGHFLKLERFGECITIRPEPQAVWHPAQPISEWERQAHLRFIPKSSSSGEWKKLKPSADRWMLAYGDGNATPRIQVRLALTSFKHVGVFPEQAANWDRIYSSLKSMKGPTRFLNLFAYTGAASLAARAAGAEVTHVDSVKQVVTWARENMEHSGLTDIRWVVEDALKFVKREVKRGNRYHGIILDPPAYGHGANGEKWKLEDQIQEMMSEVVQLLNPNQHFIILNAYSLGFSSLILPNLFQHARRMFPQQTLEVGELYLPAQSGLTLPLGVWGMASLNL